MRKSVIVGCVVMLLASVVLGRDERITLLRPRGSAVDSDVLHLTKKDLESHSLKDLLVGTTGHTSMGLLDTLVSPLSIEYSFGAVPGDTMASFFAPPAGCWVKSVGIFTEEWNGQFNDGFDLLITKASVNPEMDLPVDSVDEKGWIGDWDVDGNWYGSSWGRPILGDVMWGDFPVSAVDGSWVWAPMDWLGYLPDSEGEPFFVAYAPVGTPGQNIGTATGDATNLPKWRGFKYYGGTKPTPSGRDGWHWRRYGWIILVEVEYYENTAPKVTFDPVGTAVGGEPRTLECHIVDVDAGDPSQAGVAEARLHYSVNGTAFQFADLNLASGSDTDGIWQGTIPGGLSGGNLVQYYFYAKDKAGAETESMMGGYSIFKKTQDVLVFYNDDAWPLWILDYYMREPETLTAKYRYDVWDGLNDGPVTEELLNMYSYYVQLDGFSPLWLVDDAVGSWITGTKKASGNVGYFWSSQEWAYETGGGSNLTFAAGDWHYDYMGLGTIVSDIEPYGRNPHPLDGLAGDPISGKLAAFAGDSLQLYHDPVRQLEFDNWNDGITSHNPVAQPCFVDAVDENNLMGLRTENGVVKTVFLSFDPLALNFGPSYYWGLEIDNVINRALDWFDAPTVVQVDEQTPVEYALEQNYPNPFNPSTTIGFVVEKAGNVKVTVYNMLGQEVARLTDGHYQAGRYTLTWDASDLASGLYVYKIVAGDFSMTKKMTLLR